MQQELGQLSFEDLLSPPSSSLSPIRPAPPRVPTALPPTPGGPLSYVLERSARRKSSIHISVLPDLTVRVVAPMRLARARIDSMIREREAWILKRRDEMRTAQLGQVQRRWVSGERLPFLDEPLELRVRSVADQKMVQAIRKDAWLDVCVPTGLADVEPIRRVVHKWYGLQAQRVFAQRVLVYTAQLGVQPYKVLVRNQSTRWGSCASDGSLRFCWRLILAPQRILDYVVVHEVSHLRHPHHQPSFWACVESILPNYRQLRDELKRNGHTYQL